MLTNMAGRVCRASINTNFMSQRMRNYIRACRKRAGLTQEDVAILLGCQSGTKVSRLERLSRRPSLEVALACQAIFGVPAHELFPGYYQQVEQLTSTRARILLKRLEQLPPHPSIETKRQALMRLITPEEKGVSERAQEP